jgi:hypothetical protein
MAARPVRHSAVGVSDRATEVGGGNYEVPVVFDLPGRWTARVVVAERGRAPVVVPVAFGVAVTVQAAEPGAPAPPGAGGGPSTAAQGPRRGATATAAVLVALIAACAAALLLRRRRSRWAPLTVPPAAGGGAGFGAEADAAARWDAVPQPAPEVPFLPPVPVPAAPEPVPAAPEPMSLHPVTGDVRGRRHDDLGEDPWRDPRKDPWTGPEPHSARLRGSARNGDEAHSAHPREEDQEWNRGALRHDLGSTDRDTGAAAAVSLADMELAQGNDQGAEELYRYAMASGSAHHAPVAAANLGLLLAARDEVDGARAAFASAIGSGHPEAAPWAAFALGELLARLGDRAGAIEAYRRAAASGHDDVAPAAESELRRLRQGAHAPPS